MSDLSSFLSTKNPGWSAELWDGLIESIGARLAPLEEQLNIQREVADAIIARGLTVIEQELAPIVAQADQILDESTAEITSKLERFEAKVTGGTVICVSNTSASLSNGATINLNVAASDREFFAPTPFLAISRASTAANWAIAKVNSFNRSTGALSATLDQVTGAGGPYTDWVITSLPAATLLQKAYLEQTLVAKTAAEGAATTSASSAAASQTARTGSEAARDQSVTAKAGSEAALNSAMGVLAEARMMIAEPLVPPTDPQIGQLWWDGTVVRVYDGVGFVPTVTASIGGLRFDEGVFGVDPDGVITVGGGFSFVMVWLNGVLLYESRGDYISASPIVTVAEATEGDEWKYWAYQAVDATDYDTKEQVSTKIETALTGKAVRVDAVQAHTPAEQGQARANIDAGILSGFRNKIINGEFWISQRDPNLPSGVGNRFGTDRWISYATTNPCLVERKLLALTEPGINSALEITPYYLRTTVGAGTATNSRASLNQRLENVRTLAGREATLSFYARADAAKDIAIEFYQRFDRASTADPFVPVSIHAGRVSLTAVWKRFDVVVDIPSIIGKELGHGSWLELSFWFSAGSFFSESTGGLGEQTGVFEITRISLVEGDATAEDDPFEPRNIGQEMALCQRYYETGRATFGGYGHSASFNYYTSQNFKVTKRATPSVTVLAELSTNVSEQIASNPTTGMFSYSYKAVAQGNIYVAATWIADAEL